MKRWRLCVCVFRIKTHLTLIQRRVFWIVCEQEHVYEVDQYTGSHFGLSRRVGDPFEDHHENKVAEQTQHEEQLRDQHKEYTADLAKVPTETQTYKDYPAESNMWRWQ